MDNIRKEPHPAVLSVGSRLKEAREKKSLTIEQVQKQTKIHSSVLIALEEGRANEILTDTYVRSFLKKYAQLLGLNVGEMLKEYFPPRAESSASNIPNPLPAEVKMIPKFLYSTAIVILVIAALLSTAVIGTKIVSAFKKAKAAQQLKHAPSAVLAKKKVPKPIKQSQKKNPYIIPKSTPLSLAIKVKEPVLVKLTRDGVLIFSRVMAKGLTENITANESIEMEISRAQALELTLNDRPIALPTKICMFTLVITRKGVIIK